MAFTPADDKIYLIPFTWEEHQRWDRIAVEVTTAQASKIARLGIYLSAPTGLPLRRLLQSSELSLAATGVLYETIGALLKPGTHWLAFAGNSTTVELESRSVEGRLGGSGADQDAGTYLSDSFSYSSGTDLPLAISSPTYLTASNIPLIALRAT